MKRVIAFVVAVAVGAATASPALSQQDPEPTRVGYLNVRRVFQEYWKKETIENQLKARKDAIEDRVKDETKKLEQQADQLQALNQDSQEFIDGKRRIDVARYELKYDYENEVRRIDREARRQETLLYKEVVRECEAFGESQGYAAIEMFAPLDEKFDQVQDLDVVVATRTVLWRDARLDVTQRILDFLNASKPK